MVKLIFKIITCFLFILSFHLSSGSKLKGEANHTFYFYSKSSSAKIITLQENQTDNFIYLKNSLKGESVTFFDMQKALDLLNSLNAKKIFSESGNDFYCEYYYTNDIADYIILNGKKVNVHLAVCGDLITIGTPIIFGSY